MKNLTVIYLCILFGLVSFAQSETSKLNLGIIIPLTGDLAEYGTAIQNGFELARKENPEKLKNIEFSYEDSRYDGKTAVDALQKLKSTNTIDLYYLWGVSPTEAMLPIAAANKLPVIAETTVKEATVGKPFVIRAARTGERIASALVAEIKKRGITSVSFLVTEIPFYMDILRHLEVLLKAEGIAVKRSQEILPSENDFKSFLLDRSIDKNEALGVFLLPSQLITFYRQAAQAKLSLKTFSADIIDSQTIIDDCPENVNGTFFTQVGLTPKFRKLYSETYKNDIQIGSAAQSYDIARLVSELFKDSASKISKEEIIKIISSMPEQNGATGTFRYFETPDAGKEIRMPVSMKEVKNKKIVVITEDTGF
jgi:branched-chain amino acid transport system substrate-binding protein